MLIRNKKVLVKKLKHQNPLIVHFYKNSTQIIHLQCFKKLLKTNILLLAFSNLSGETNKAKL